MPTPAERLKGRRQFSITLPDDHALMLERVAESGAARAASGPEGSKSAAVEMLLDLYGGKVLERIQQEKEQADLAAIPVEVTRWRTPKLSVELIAYMAGLVRAGNMTDVACQIAGITPRQKTAWMKRGRTDRQNETESLYSDLVAALERAEAECEAEDIRLLRAHGRTSWTALAWRLERQYPDRYAQRKRVDGHVQHSVFPMIDWDRLSALETRSLVELLRKASPDIDDVGISRAARPAIEVVPADVLEVIDVEPSEPRALPPGLAKHDA